MSFSGKNITVNNNNIFVDGIDVTPNTKEINISVEGNIEQLEISACNKCLINGDVGIIKTQSGSVEVNGNIKGSISTMSGSVDCEGSIEGSVSTMSGNIKSKK